MLTSKKSIKEINAALNSAFQSSCPTSRMDNILRCLKEEWENEGGSTVPKPFTATPMSSQKSHRDIKSLFVDMDSKSY